MELLLLTALLAVSCESLSGSSLFTGSTEHEVVKYKMQIQILIELLSRECPSYALGKRDDLDQLNIHLKVLQINYQRLVNLFIECKKEKADPSTLPTTSSAGTTTPPANCPTNKGYSELHIQLLTYSNPSNKKGFGVPCEQDGSPCDIVLEICVSPLNSSSCEFYYTITDVVGSKSIINLSGNHGNTTNPLKIDLGTEKWQGAHVLVTVLDKNDANNLRDYHEVDEFSYELTDVQGSHRLITLYGQRATDKTELKVIFTVPCPSPLTTQPTTPTTPTTTTIPPPVECLSVTNLTQSWRLEHNGKGIKGGGPRAHSEGYACDMYNMGWFRFAGAAGRRMLDSCPKGNSCGTRTPFWTDVIHPQLVGKAVTISLYGSAGGICKKYRRTIEVMRCSRNTEDFIYKYTYSDETNCYGAFCGMN